ncbi:MAG TPA: hypothetical protein VFF52_04805 [Isosphaeraceae bacterium]|nr:hypothetical protein [Isosphaeraceae bacterium]
MAARWRPSCRGPSGGSRSTTNCCTAPRRAAPLEHLPDAELEALDEQAVSLAERFRLHPPHQR